MNKTTEIKVYPLFLSSEESKFLLRAVKIFNDCQSLFHMKLQSEPSHKSATERVLDWSSIKTALQALSNGDYSIFVTSKPLTDNWFSHTSGSVSIISTNQWLESYSPPHVDGYLLIEFCLVLLIETCSLNELQLNPHEACTGCLFDFCAQKSDIRFKIRCGYICAGHKERFLQFGVQPNQIVSIEALLDKVRDMALGRAGREPSSNLASSSFDDAKSQKLPSHDLTVDVVILCALQSELEMVLNALDPTKAISAWVPFGQLNGSHTYYESEIRSVSNQSIRVIAGAARHMGLTASAILTSEAISFFRPKLVLMAGIAAGADKTKQFLGDILVGESAFNYGAGKQQPNTEGGFQPDFRSVEIHGSLARMVRECANDRKLVNDVIERWSDKSKDLRRLSVHIGPIGSSDQVMNDSDRVLDIKKHVRKLIGLEMETYAMYRACVDSIHHPLYLSFKSICDFAAEKTDDWQSCAAWTSSQFAVSFLRHKWDAIRKMSS